MIDGNVQRDLFKLANAAGLASGFSLESVIVSRWDIVYTWEKINKRGECRMYRAIVDGPIGEVRIDLYKEDFEKCAREMAATN